MKSLEAVDFDHIIMVDIETTGLGPGALPIEIAWIRVDSNLNETSRATSLLNPGIPIEAGASAVNGITDDMLSNSPTLEHFMRSTNSDPFATGRTLVIAHNAPFDYPYIKPFCNSSNSLCTMRIARYLFQRLADHKLATLCNHLNLNKLTTHRAMADTEACLALAKHMAEQNNSGLDGLLNLSARALSEMRMPFGKYKNTPISDLPSSYVRWMRTKLDDLDGDLEACLALHHPYV